MFSPGALVKVNVVYFGLGHAVFGDYKVQENKNDIKEYKCQIVLIRKNKEKKNRWTSEGKTGNHKGGGKKTNAVS